MQFWDILTTNVINIYRVHTTMYKVLESNLFKTLIWTWRILTSEPYLTNLVYKNLACSRKVTLWMYVIGYLYWSSNRRIVSAHRIDKLWIMINHYSIIYIERNRMCVLWLYYLERTICIFCFTFFGNESKS